MILSIWLSISPKKEEKKNKIVDEEAKSETKDKKKQKKHSKYRIEMERYSCSIQFVVSFFFHLEFSILKRHAKRHTTHYIIKL